MSTIRKNSTSSVINPSNGESLSLSFLHKKRHSDSSVEHSTTGSSPTILSTSNSTSSIPRLVRKKSGELVKSNLKLNCLNNAGFSKSMPTTPLYNKSVHFGQDVDVRYFHELDKPTAVSANTSPILKGRGRRGSGRFGRGNKIIGGGFGFGYDFNYDYDSIDDSDSDDSDDEFALYDILWDLETVNFGKIKYNEKIQVMKSLIFLERIMIDEEENSITGMIAVKNLSFEKDVHIRYTFDNWKTVVEIESFYIDEVPKILKRANYDRFKFKINLKNFQFSQKTDIRLYFCIRYRYKPTGNSQSPINGTQEVWDNNDYKNYEILIKRTKRRKFKSNHQFLLNDYLTGHTNVKDDDVINSYFNNYEAVLKSPETPKVLKNELIDNGEPSPNFQLRDEANDDLDKPMDELSLHNQLNQNNNNSEDIPKHNNNNFKLNKHKKPMINSKSYQDLLDSYCFFKSDDQKIQSPTTTSTGPTTIASYLDETIDKN